jgi:SsrA-binding protein
MAAKKKSGSLKDPITSGIVASNRRASHKYELLDKYECGIQLLGSEVKSLRQGAAQLADAYASIDGEEIWLHNMHIPPYAPAAGDNHNPERSRKLLLHRYQIEKLMHQTSEKGLTLVPTKVYFSGRTAKVEIAVARGKQLHDKRRTIKEKEMKREMERAVGRRR